MDRRTQAIEQVYRRRYAAFRSALVCVTGSGDAAHDVVQEAFARALRARESFRGEGSLEGWLWRIAFRVALEPRRNGSELPLEEAFLEAAAPEWRDPELAAALWALPPRRKLVVFLRYFADLSYAEIGELCGISVGTVGAVLAQAHAELLEALEREGASR